jgi:Asp-tRNA(Asn)/Glu-tRNA(Gln) amidotransferase A subunit family amidase
MSHVVRLASKFKFPPIGGKRPGYPLAAAHGASGRFPCAGTCTTYSIRGAGRWDGKRPEATPFGDNLVALIVMGRMPVQYIIAMSVICTMLMAPPAPAGAQQGQFRFQEATIASIHAAFAAGRLTCAQLTRLYLDRIAAYDMQGPALHAIITVNPEAMGTAAEMDRSYRASLATVGPLHCIPVILKDNFNTFDMPTTGGNVSMKSSVPLADACRSSRAVACRFRASAVRCATHTTLPAPPVAPAAAPVRVDRRQFRGAGHRQRHRPVDTLSRLCQQSRRYPPDPRPRQQGRCHFQQPDPGRSWPDDALKGARIGVMTNLYGAAERHAEVNKVMEGVIARMAGLGAAIVRFDLPEYEPLASTVSTSQFEARTVMDRYFAALGPNAPIKSFAELVAAKTSAVQKTLEAELAVVDGMDSQTYRDRMLNRDKLRLAVAKKMADLNLDAVLYPLQSVLVAPVTAEEQMERNGTLSNGTGFPAITFPGGFSTPTASAPLGVPVGAELLGLDYTEAKLVSFAYAFEQAGGLRKLPKSTPPLPNEP